MDVKEIEERVAKISANACDDERAHLMEDDLYRELLSHIALDAPSPWRDLAAAALKAWNLEFARWYA